MRSIVTAGFVVMALCPTGAARATEACIPAIASLDVLVAPSSGATAVPINVVPVLKTDAADSALHLRIDDVDIASRSEAFSVEDGFGATAFRRLLPDADLPTNTEVAVVVDDVVVGRFTTGALRDVTAPAVPGLGESKPFSGGACTPFVELALDDPDEPVVFVAQRAEDVTLNAGAAVHGLSRSSPVVVGSDSAGDDIVAVVAIDLAGNVSATATTTVTFPATFGELPFGCSGSGAGSVGDGTALVAVLTVLGLRRRRRTAPSA